jgi:general secretion pathway protein I
MCSETAERGFTLLEVLVAFIIAALALGVLFEGGLSGLRAAQTAARYQEAVSRARSHLAALSAPGALVPGDLQGDDGGGYHWHVRVAPITTAAPVRVGDAQSTVFATAATLYAVSVAISWKGDGGRRVVELDSRRLGPAAKQGP